MLAAAVLIAPSSAGAAACPVSLQTSINNAVDGDVVTAPAGTCSVNLSITNTHAFTLQADPSGSTLTPTTTTTPIVTANAAVKFTITGLTFSGTTAASAISINSSAEAATLRGNTFINNHNDGSFNGGGAVFIRSGDPPTTNQPTVIDGNQFGQIGSGNSAGFAGALELIGGAAFRVTNNSFVANSSTDASSGWGGAMASSASGSDTNPVTLSGNTFGGSATGAGNISFNDGAGAVFQQAPGQTLILDHNSFIDNHMTGVAGADRVGGGLLLAPNNGLAGFPVMQTGNLFTGNVIDSSQSMSASSPGAGGGGEWVLGVTVTSVGDVFTGNQVNTTGGHVPEGGGVGVLGVAASGGTPAQPGSFTGSDDVFRGNSIAAGGWGGAAYVGNPVAFCSTGCPGSHMTLNDSTLSGNSVASGAGSEGGALWGTSSDTLAVNNSIIFGNSAGSGQPDVFGFNSPTFQFTDVCTVPGSGTALPGAGNICSDPKLNGAGEETGASPTIDQGSNALVPAGLTTDFEGHPRITEGIPGTCTAIVDMGAFESPTVAPAATCSPSKPTPPGPAGTLAAVGRETISPYAFPAAPSGASAQAAKKKRKYGTEVTYTLNIAASVRFTVQQARPGRKVKHGKKTTCDAITRKNRKKKRCTRTVTSKGSFTRTGAAGTNKFHFTGRLNGKRLPPGKYTLVATPTANGKTGHPDSARFKIIR